METTLITLRSNNLHELLNPPATKICRDCRQEKPRSEFGKYIRNKDGKRTTCRECERKRKTQKEAERKIYRKKIFDYD